MKTRNLKIALLGGFLLIPGFAFCQTETMLSFLSGDGTFEKWFMEIFSQFDTEIENRALSASILGRAIGGLGAMFYLGHLGWQMQAGERNWDITPMLRPLIVGLILIHWTGFVKMIQFPLQKLAEPGMAIFKDLEKDANDIRELKFKKQTELVDFLVKNQAEFQAQQEEMDQLRKSSDASWFDGKMSQLLLPIKEYALRIQFNSSKIMGDAIELMSLAILRVCTYFIFFVQKVWAYILIVLGPIAIGISLIPGFESSFNNWIAKFININLYTFVAYTIINIGQQLIMAGHKMELYRFETMLDKGSADLNLVIFYVSNNGLMYTAIFPVVAHAVTGIGVLMTPTIADAIVTAGGAGIMTKARGVVRSTARIARAGVKSTTGV